MRTVEEIQQQINRHPDEGTYGYQHAMDIAHDEGFDSGMRQGMVLIQQGKTSAEILHYAQADELGYRPYGNDSEDAWQSGYSTALYWCAEQFDWDAEGKTIFREGNIWNESVG